MNSVVFAEIEIQFCFLKLSPPALAPCKQTLGCFSMALMVRITKHFFSLTDIYFFLHSRDESKIVHFVCTMKIEIMHVYMNAGMHTDSGDGKALLHIQGMGVKKTLHYPHGPEGLTYHPLITSLPSLS